MSRKLKIAIVDDEPDMRESISQWLVLSGFETETFASAEDALKVIGPDWPDAPGEEEPPFSPGAAGQQQQGARF